METSIAVTPRERTSNRTAADSQPIPRLDPAANPVARLPALGDADKVVQWLNASKGTTSHDRVVWIRRELEELPSYFATHADAYVDISGGIFRLGEWPRKRRREWPKEKLRVQRQFHDRHVALNETLEKYVFRPRSTFIMAPRLWMFGMVPDENKRRFKIQIAGETISEADAALSLVRLAQTGDLRKVRLCEMCKERWRVAAKRSYRFCSDQCREAFYATSPEYHSRKAANQRKYRETLKRNEAALGDLWKEK